MWLSDGLHVVVSTGDVVRFTQVDLDTFPSRPKPDVSSEPADAVTAIADIAAPLDPLYDDRAPNLCADSPADIDELSRERFEKQIAVAFRELAKSDVADGPAILLAGAWGCGKSSSARRVAKTLEQGADPTDLWTIAKFDSWRDRRSDPAWFGILRSLRKAVEPRGVVEKLGFRVREFVFRARSTGGPFAAATSVLVLVTALVATNGTGPKGLEVILGIPTLVVAVFALSRDLRRRLNWDSFSSGRLASDEKSAPLGEVEDLALWFRQQAGRKSWVDQLGFGLIVVPFGCAFVWWLLERPTVDGATEWWRRSWAYIVLVCLALAIGLLWSGAKRKCFYCFALAALVLCIVLNLFLPDNWRFFRPSRHMAFIAAFVLIEYGLAFEALLQRKHGHLLLVVEDLDRCAAEEVADVLDTLSTVFRPNLTKASPLCVLVVADDVWIADAYAKRHSALNSAPDSALVGWSFLAKHFDLALRLPHPRDADLQKVLGVSPQRSSEGVAPPGPPQEPPKLDREILLQPSPAGSEAEPYGVGARDITSSPTIQKSDAEFAGHLLELHIQLAGRNVRAVRRAGNYYWFLSSTFPHLPTTTLAKACLAISDNPSLIDDGKELDKILGADSDLFRDALGVTPTPPNAPSLPGCELT